MKVYIDVILFINFAFDFLLLFFVNIILKIRVNLLRLILASIIGSLSVLMLFVNVNSLVLFMIKLLISVIMILISFGKKDFLKNITYLYFVSIILGGFLFFLNMQTSYKNEGLIFFNNGFSINIIILFILSPIIFIYYYKQSRYFEDTLSNVHTIEIELDGKIYNYRAYLDTGNKLYEPFKNREVSILYDKKLYEELEYYLIVPFTTLTEKGILKGKVAKRIIIDKKYVFKDVVLGITNKEFNLDKSEVILHANFKNRL